MAKITLKAARVSAGYTQEKIAEKLGVSRSLVIDWEKGNAEMKAFYLYAFCYITGFSESDILLPERYANSELEDFDADQH